MSKMKFNRKKHIAIVVIAAILLGFYAFMIARPISYGMGYHTVSTFEDEKFEGKMTFGRDGIVTIENTNFDEAMRYPYYYKDGYVFFLMGETEEACKEEIAAIDANFEEALNTPFYSSKINAFRLLSEESDGYSDMYTCTPFVMMVVVGALVELMLISFACVSGVRSGKAKWEEQENK